MDNSLFISIWEKNKTKRKVKQNKLQHTKSSAKQKTNKRKKESKIS